jgi:short-subunit dehydrogenase
MARIVITTGASAGVGREVARRFAEEGPSSGLIARDDARLAETAGEVQAAGGSAIACPADLADHAAVEQTAERIESELGPIDAWIDVAMATVFAPFRDTTAEEFGRATEVTCLGFVHVTMAALKRMQPLNRGVIVQVGSALAYRSIPLQSACCGAKHAIVGFTDSIRSELIRDGSEVRLTVVHLPTVNTPQFDRGASGFLDRMLARKAYGGQMSDGPATGGPDTLFQSVDGGYGAHGRFHALARNPRLQLWAAKDPAWAASVPTVLGLLLLVVLLALLT